MPTFVEIAVNVPQVSNTFHYHLPPELEGRVETGHLVTVPFGKQLVQGIVLDSMVNTTVSKTKAVSELLDPEPALTPAQLDLANYLSYQTLTPLSTCISLMLPPGISQMADTLYSSGITREQLALGTHQGTLQVTDAQWRLITMLIDRGPLRGRQIDRALPRKNWNSTAEALKRRNLITSQPVLSTPTVKPKMVRTAQLACSLEVAEAHMDQVGRAGYTALERRQRMLRFLMRETEPVDVTWVYAESGGNLSDLKKLAKMGLVFLGESEKIRDPLGKLDFIPNTPPELTSEQTAVWNEIKQGLLKAAAGQVVKPYLLYGVTGSGKTEIYLHALEAIIQQGKTAIILVPEIALTPQTVRRFVSRFPGKIGLVHSKLSSGERYDTWRRARAGLISAVVGPRSALFTPFSNLGLIVLDECHDQSYYQSETPPSYHARETAAEYAQQVGAVCLMGSATPDIVSTYRAARGDWTPLNLPQRILAHKEAIRLQLEQIDQPKHVQKGIHSGVRSPGIRHYRPLEKDAETTDLPPVHIVDMRAELKAGNRSIFSEPLHNAIKHALDNGQQAILFINRRGMATFIFCRDCGYSMKCPRCDIPLTFHTGTSSQQETRKYRGFNNLICHHCGYQRNLPTKCPECGGSRIKQCGTGTERVEQEVQTQFPNANTIRWDWETTRKKGAHDVILDHFANHQADVLIGTQMLAKGLDLPLVTLVGVVLADVGLNLPDYRAAERTFQVLTQVAGRAGRSPLGGQAILQTFQPEHYVITSAAGHDYRGFYKQELAHRQNLGYPPYSRLIRLEFRGDYQNKVEASANKAAAEIKRWLIQGKHQSTEILGPTPCFFMRIGGYYRWQIVLRGSDPAAVLRNKNLGSTRVEVDPPSLL
jgi:primosomal protein N' (replication factor Y)